MNVDLVHIEISEKEKQAVQSVLESGHLAQGKKVEELEGLFSKACDAKYSIATTNGTTALHTALWAAGIQPGDEVITTPFTFIATATSIRMCGATPVFVDTDDTYNIDTSLIEQAITPKTKAILPVHLYGQICDMDNIKKIANDHDLKVVEDAAQAVNATFNDKKAGSLGDVATFSLYATKNIMSGEGGIVTTNSSEIMEKSKLFRNHGQNKQYDYVDMGYNYRMTDVLAAIGVEQMKRVTDITKKRRENALTIIKGISDIEGIQTPILDPRINHAFHQLTIRVKGHSLSRDQLREQLAKKDISTGIYYPTPLHLCEAFSYLGHKKGDLPVSEELSEQVLSLPCHPYLKEEQIHYLIDTLCKLT